eukprot:INCI3645.2.p1 GENE.INCI3645.2~~INCI3645.2.p1  ORF type:complete len:194 (+),score=37.35 INCI3645.2:449-1030(+)
MPHDCVLLQRTIATRVVRALNFLLPVRFFLCSNARFRRPNRARAQEVFQRAAKVGALHASRKRLPLCKDTQSAFYNLGVCLRDNVGAPLRRDGTYRYDMTALEIDEEWDKFKASRADWMARTYRTAEDFAAAKDKFVQRLRRREKEQAAARKKLAEECFEKCKNEWKASAKWVAENLSTPVPGGPKYTKFGDT